MLACLNHCIQPLAGKIWSAYNVTMWHGMAVFIARIHDVIIRHGCCSPSCTRNPATTGRVPGLHVSSMTPRVVTFFSTAHVSAMNRARVHARGGARFLL